MRDAQSRRACASPGQAAGIARVRDLRALGDAIWYCSQRSAIEGIRDLRPLRAERSFLKKLIDSEEADAPAGRERRLEILAIGGEVVPRRSFWARLAGCAFGDSHHDLIVEKSSSTPSDISTTRGANCDHFSYFDAGEVAKDHFGAARVFLREMLQLHNQDEAELKADLHQPPASLPLSGEGEAEVRFGGLLRDPKPKHDSTDDGEKSEGGERQLT